METKDINQVIVSGILNEMPKEVQGDYFMQMSVNDETIVVNIWKEMSEVISSTYQLGQAMAVKGFLKSDNVLRAERISFIRESENKS